MKKAGFGLMVLVFAVVLGFVFLGCDTGGGGGGGDYVPQQQEQQQQTQTPSFESVIVAVSDANVRSWTEATSFQRGNNIFFGIKNLKNGNQSGIKYRCSLYQDSTFKGVVEEGTMPSAPSALYTGKFNEIQGNIASYILQVGTGYSFEWCFIDSSGNPFNVKKTNTFSITN